LIRSLILIVIVKEKKEKRKIHKLIIKNHHQKVLMNNFNNKAQCIINIIMSKNNKYKRLKRNKEIIKNRIRQ